MAIVVTRITDNLAKILYSGGTITGIVRIQVSLYTKAVKIDKLKLLWTLVIFDVDPIKGRFNYVIKTRM